MVDSFPCSAIRPQPTSGGSKGTRGGQATMLVRTPGFEFGLQNIHPSFGHRSWVSIRAPAPSPPHQSAYNRCKHLLPMQHCDFNILEATMTLKVYFLLNHFPKLPGKEQNRIGRARRGQRDGPTT